MLRLRGAPRRPALAAADRAGGGAVVLLRAPARGFAAGLAGCTAARRNTHDPTAHDPAAARILADLGIIAPMTLPLPDPLADAG